jgi:hypothetical protein
VAQAAASGTVAASTALERAATRIQAAFRGYAVRKVYKIYKIGGVVNEMLYAPALGFAPPRGAPAPFGRIAAAAAVVGNALWMYGGMVEFGDNEVTFDDVWRLDLAYGNATLRGAWTAVRVGTAVDAVGEKGVVDLAPQPSSGLFGSGRNEFTRGTGGLLEPLNCQPYFFDADVVER